MNSLTLAYNSSGYEPYQRLPLRLTLLENSWFMVEIKITTFDDFEITTSSEFFQPSHN